MGRHIRHGELLLGVEGAALLRRLFDGPDEFITDRLSALRRILDGLDDGPFSVGVDVPELDVGEGYAAWAPVYDVMENALIEAETPLVERALADVRAGRALDAACGTGRHAARLAAHGHAVVGVDQSEAMLDRARTKVPDADLRTGDLTALPLSDGSVDVAVCALALTHLTEPARAIAELARVVRHGGRIVISDAHPTFVLLVGQALFPNDGGFAFVRNHVMLHSTYLAAFADAGLRVLECAEAPMEADFSHGLYAPAADAAAALWSDLPVALVWTLDRADQA